jgi:hypothetical protein
MSVKAIKIGCDIHACSAYCQTDQPTIKQAREVASDRHGWAYRDGMDICPPCGRGDTPLSLAARKGGER